MVILSLLIGMIKHSQITQKNKFAISLQYLEKKLCMEFLFHMQYLIKVTRHVQSTQNRKLVTFLQYLNKKRLFDFVCGE